MTDIEHKQQADDIQQTVHHLDKGFVQLDKRVSVLEERSRAQAEDIKQIHHEVRETKGLIQGVSQKIDEHWKEDSEKRDNTKNWIIGIAISVAITFLTIILKGGVL